MKAHIVSDPRALLLWHFAAGSTGYDAVCRAAAAYRLPLREITEADLDTPVGALCGMRGVTPADAPYTLPEGGFALPAMIVAGLSNASGDLNAFISALRETGAVLPLKAMVTPTSRAWPLGHLLGELSAEHLALHALPDADQPEDGSL